jgi:hypothetical protein
MMICLNLHSTKWIKECSDSEPEPPCCETVISSIQRQKLGKRTHHTNSTSSGDEDHVQVSVCPSKAHRIERDSSVLAELPPMKHDHASRARHAEESPPKKCGHGRPHKPVVASPKTQRHFNIAVFVEIAVPLKFQPGELPGVTRWRSKAHEQLAHSL